MNHQRLVRVSLWIPALALLVVAQMTAVAGAALSELDDAIADSDLAIAVYDLSKTQIGDWKQIARQSDPDGFKAAVYERTLANGKRDLRVAFAGSDDWNDAAVDVRQGAFLPRSIYDDIDEKEFERAQAFAAGYIHMTASDANVSSFRLVGHSLGGALAQYVSAKTGADATVYNSAALLKMEDRLSDSEKQQADRHVKQYYGNLDFVQRPTRWIGGTQHGALFLLESVDGNLLAAHSVQNLSKSLAAARRDLEKNPSSERYISQRTPITQEQADLLIRNLTLIAEGVEELKHTVDVKMAFGQANRYSAAMSQTLGKIAKSAKLIDSCKGIYDLADAIRKDQEQFRNQPFVLLHSYTFETLANAAMTGFSIPGLKETPGGAGLLKTLYTTLDDYKLIPPQIRTSLLRESIDVGAPSFGALDFVRAGFGSARQGYIGIDEIDAIADGIVGLVWAGVGLVTSGGNLRVAEMYQETAQVVAQDARLFLRETGADKQFLRWLPDWVPVFGKLGSEYRAQASQILEMYQVIQTRRAHDGQQIQSFDQFLEGDFQGSKGSWQGDEAEIKKAFTPQDWQNLARIEAILMTNSGKSATPTAPVPGIAPSAKDVGGIMMAPEPVRDPAGSSSGKSKWLKDRYLRTLQSTNVTGQQPQ